MRAADQERDILAALRASLLLGGFLGLTLPLMPVQAALLAARSRHARSFPHWYHRRLCRLLGIRLHVTGEIVRDRPVLVVSNHVSWLDIPVLSAVAPVSFVAKKEVGTWPLVAELARLQRTVFVDRTRRAAVGDVAGEMLERLGQGDALILFAEGTSSDGNRVLPFKTSLFAAAKPSRAVAGVSASADGAPVVQTLAIAYTHLHGLPLGRAERPRISWYGDMEMASHAWELLKSGPIDVRIDIGQPMPLAAFDDRKALATQTERAVRHAVIRLLRRHAVEPDPAPVGSDATGPEPRRPVMADPEPQILETYDPGLEVDGGSSAEALIAARDHAPTSGLAAPAPLAPTVRAEAPSGDHSDPRRS